MIDVHREQLLTIEEACKPLRAMPSTVHRYVTHGVGGVVLESVKIGRRYTSREAISRFIARLNGQQAGAAPDAQQAPPDIDKQQMEAALDAALQVA